MNENLHRDVGRVEAEQAAMRRDLESLTADVKELNRKIDHLVAVIDRAKGGWKTLVAVGTVVAAITAAAAKLLAGPPR